MLATAGVMVLLGLLTGCGHTYAYRAYGTDGDYYYYGNGYPSGYYGTYYYYDRDGHRHYGQYGQGGRYEGNWEGEYRGHGEHGGYEHGEYGEGEHGGYEHGEGESGGGEHGGHR